MDALAAEEPSAVAHVTHAILLNLKYMETHSETLVVQVAHESRNKIKATDRFTAVEQNL